MAPIVGMDDLAEVTLSGVQEVLTWETEADYATAVDSPGMVADDLGDHAGGAVAADGYHYGSLTRGLVAYYSLDEGAGTTAGDATELGNDGTITGATWNGSGQVGSDSLSFDGVDDYVSGIYALGGASTFTVSGWVRFDTFGTNHTFLEDWDSGTNPRAVNCYFNNVDSTTMNANIHLEDSAGNTTFNVISTNIQDNLTTGEWAHATWVWDGGVIKFYLNGTELTSAAYSVSALNGPSASQHIGALQTLTTDYLNGDIDDVRIYDRALSTPEIQALANRTATSPVPTGATL